MENSRTVSHLRDKDRMESKDEKSYFAKCKFAIGVTCGNSLSENED